MNKIGVILRNDEEFDRGFKRFKKVFERAGIIRLIKKHAFYEPPSEIRKKIKNQLKRLKKANRKK